MPQAVLSQPPPLDRAKLIAILALLGLSIVAIGLIADFALVSLLSTILE